jgi:hypothetical protein
MVLLLAPWSAAADKEMANEPHVLSSEYGDCYAKSTPEERYGERGTTQIFKVEKGPDTLLQTHAWYAQEFYFDCSLGTDRGVSVVQLGPWPRGSSADQATLAVAFYLNGRLLRRYSTLDIAGGRDNVSKSATHYTVIDKVLGYRWDDTTRRLFAIRTVDKRVLFFDAALGTRIPTPESIHP